jgi:hypothetical protein
VRPLFCGLLLALATSAASAAPASAPASQPVEHELLPPGRPPQTRASQGRWLIAARRIVAPGGTAFWIAGGPGSTLTDGQLRVQAAGGSLALGVLLRGRLDESGSKLVEGITVQLRGREAWLAHEHHGKSQRVGHVVKLRRWPQRSAVELTALLVGPHVWVNIFEAATGAHLAMLAGEHASPGDGVGLLGAQGRKPTAVTRMSTRTACPPSALRASPPRTPPVPAEAKGPFIVALLPEAEAKLVESSPVTRRLDRHAGEPPRLAYRVNAVGLESLFCAGRTVVGLQTDFPWKYLDVDYSEQKKQPLAKTSKGFRIDLSSKSPEMVEALLRGWQKRYPKLARLSSLGKSHQGRQLWALALGEVAGAETRPAVLLDGAHHGDEPFSVELTLDAAQELLERSDEPRVQRWLKELTIWCVPVVNPDGLAAFLEVARTTGRKNGRGLTGPDAKATDAGVDLNRNYPFRWSDLPDRKAEHYRGPSPASEPETQGMMALATRERFVSSVSFHSGTVAVLAPYTIDGVKNPLPNEAWLVAEEIVRTLAPHPQGRVFRVRRKLYPVAGTDQDWLRHEHGTVAYILESARHTPIGSAERNRVVSAVRPFWEQLLDRFLDGPSLSGHVVDDEGHPVEAEVRLKELQLGEGERWTTRPRDGRFDRYLPRTGRFHVEVVRCGKVIATRAVLVGKERARLEIRVPRGRACETP